jgi:3-dehydroquinate synthase
MRAVGAPGRVVVVTNDVVGPLHADDAERSLVEAGWSPTRVTIPDGEACKDLSTWRGLVEQILECGVDRHTPVVALGGGVTGDIAGFAAATVLRGLPFVQVPTTLLAMVDASVGGKVGVNTARGKNLVGAFWQPRLVYAAVSTLSTLSDPELRCGLGEVLKHAVLVGEQEICELENEAIALLDRDVDCLASWVRKSVECKARVVAADPRETGVRATLNLGHTLGHAIESVAGFGQIRHGEAVAMGLVGVSRFAESRGWAEPGFARRLAALAIELGLPSQCPTNLGIKELCAAVAFDKKRGRATLTLVVPCAPGRVELRPLPLGEVPELVKFLF